MRKLSSINGPNVSETLLDRVMYNAETLPPWEKNTGGSFLVKMEKPLYNLCC